MPNVFVGDFILDVFCGFHVNGDQQAQVALLNQFTGLHLENPFPAE